jgi:hypothetical protein
MKKLVLALAVILIAGLSSASANDPVYVNKRVSAAFQSDFTHAKNVSWVESPKYVMAQFSMNNKVMFAYYNHDGSFIGVIHNILTTDLPDNLRHTIKKGYGSYWVSELFRMDTDLESSYYIRLENGTESIVLSSDGAEGWKIFSVTNSSGKESASL